jgi:hypothetical protein
VTNFQKAISNASRPYNKKDGVARPPSLGDQYEDQGFKQIDWNRWEYTWQGGDFPVFQVGPGILDDKAGVIAKFGDTININIHFPYGTDPADIKARLDDEILGIMCYDAGIEEQPLTLDWIDVDEWMVAA